MNWDTVTVVGRVVCQLLSIVSIVMIFVDGIRQPDNPSRLLRWIILLLASVFWFYQGDHPIVGAALAAIGIAMIFRPK